MNVPNLPSTDQLRPWLDRLETEPEGCVILSITLDPTRSPALVSWAFLSAEERTALRKAVKGVNRKRRAAGGALTNEEPRP